MSVSSVQNLASNYFSTLNPIAEKIYIDIAATKDAYEDLWNTLSYREQNKIIDETIIHPEVVLKYSFCEQCDEKVEYFYSSYFHVGEKFGESSWHDEHSAPFSWMTRSQLDLKVFRDQEGSCQCEEVPNSVSDGQKTIKIHSFKESFVDPPRIVLGGSTSKFANSITSESKYSLKSKINNEEQTFFGKLKSSAAIIKSQTIKSALNKANIDNSQKKCTGYENDVLLKSKNKCTIIPSSNISKLGATKPVISKPKSPPPPPPSKSKCVLTENSRNHSETKALLCETVRISPTNLCNKDDVTVSKGESFEAIQTDDSSRIAYFSVPKTGFDFLDNW